MHTIRRWLLSAAGSAILVLTFSSFSSLAAAQDAKPVCDLVTEQDVATVTGPVQKKQAILGADQCTFSAKGLSLSIHRVPKQKPENVQMLLDLPKNRARPGDVVNEETGIGDRAVSERSKGRLTLIAASGTTVWTVGVEHVYNQDLTDKLPALRDLVRKVIAGSPKAP